MNACLTLEPGGEMCKNRNLTMSTVQIEQPHPGKEHREDRKEGEGLKLWWLQS